LNRCLYASGIRESGLILRLGYDSLGGVSKGEGKNCGRFTSYSTSIFAGIIEILSPLPRPYSVSVSLFASADPFIVTLQAIQKHFRNRKKYFSIA